MRAVYALWYATQGVVRARAHAKQTFDVEKGNRERSVGGPHDKKILLLHEEETMMAGGKQNENILKYSKLFNTETFYRSQRYLCRSLHLKWSICIPFFGVQEHLSKIRSCTYVYNWNLDLRPFFDVSRSRWHTHEKLIVQWNEDGVFCRTLRRHPYILGTRLKLNHLEVGNLCYRTGALTWNVILHLSILIFFITSETSKYILFSVLRAPIFGICAYAEVDKLGLTTVRFCAYSFFYVEYMQSTLCSQKTIADNT